VVAVEMQMAEEMPAMVVVVELEVAVVMPMEVAMLATVAVEAVEAPVAAPMVVAMLAMVAEEAVEAPVAALVLAPSLPSTENRLPSTASRSKIYKMSSMPTGWRLCSTHVYTAIVLAEMTTYLAS